MKNTYLLILLLLVGCTDNGAKTVLDSDDYSSTVERVSTLQAQIIAKSDFYDAEFELFNVNGYSNSRISVPGASSWDYKFAIKVSPADVDKWIDGMVKMDIKYDAFWIENIIKNRKENWQPKSTPEIYIREEAQTTLLIHRPEGILFKRVVQH